MKNVYEAMQYANPYARHSPSLVDTVGAGAEEMTDIQKAALEDQWRMFKLTYEKQLAMLVNFWKVGGNLSYVLERNNAGAITGGSLMKHPSGMDFWRDLVPMLNALQQMGIDYAPLETVKAQLQNEYNSSNESRAYTPPTATAPPPMRSVFTPRPVHMPTPYVSDTIRHGGGAIGGAAASMDQRMLRLLFGNAHDGAASDAMENAQKNYMNMLRAGVVPPDDLGPYRNDTTNQEPSVVINMPIENVRTEADIAAIAEKVMMRLEMRNFRTRR